MAFAYGEPSPMGPGIVRLVAKNPSPFTFKGTNTISSARRRSPSSMRDPTTPRIAQAILKAAGGRPITHIISTHAHRDHVDGIAKLKAKPAP